MRRYARPVHTTSHHFDATGPVFYACIGLALAGFGVLYDSNGNAAAGTTVATLSPHGRMQGAHHEQERQPAQTSEVTWEQGRGRQPYSNQGPVEADEPGPGEIAEGNRGEASGRNAEQLDQVRKMP